MSRRRGHEYTKLSQREQDECDAGGDGTRTPSSHFSASQQSVKIPWKAIILATFLCIAGSIALVTGTMIVTGHIDPKYSDRMWPLIILGIISFIPGAYHVRIAYLSFMKRPGYSFENIPEFD